MNAENVGCGEQTAILFGLSPIVFVFLGWITAETAMNLLIVIWVSYQLAALVRLLTVSDWEKYFFMGGFTFVMASLIAMTAHMLGHKPTDPLMSMIPFVPVLLLSMFTGLAKYIRGEK